MTSILTPTTDTAGGFAIAGTEIDLWVIIYNIQTQSNADPVIQEK